jgi:hypothetical protein
MLATGYDGQELSVRGLHTNDVDEAAQNDSPLATNHVGQITRDERTNESTSGQDGHDKRSVATSDSASAIWGVEALGTDGTLDLLDEEGRVEHTVDITGIITCVKQAAISKGHNKKGAL